MPGSIVHLKMVLKPLNPRFIPLREGDFIQEPIRSGGVGDIFHAIGEQDCAVQTVPVLVLAAGKLLEVGCGECRSLRHRMASFV